MSATEHTTFAGSVPDNYDRYLGPILFEPYALDLKHRLQDEELKTVLELACGTGRVTRHLTSLLPDNSQLTATDLNPDMLAHAKSKLNSPQIKWQVVDAQQLPFDEDTFDHIVCQFGVMFFPEKLKAFKEAYRVLKNNGVFLFNTWDSLEHNRHSLLVQIALRKLMGEEAPDFMEKGPFSFFDESIIKSLLIEAGFQSIQIEIVRKDAFYENDHSLMQGFMEGSPLANFIKKLPAVQQKRAKEEVEKEIITTFGENNHHFSMQALVCRAVK